MTWNVNGQEFENVTHLAPERRYEYFIKKVADWREVWSLWNEGWALMGDKDHEEMVPVWPHAVFAEASAVGEWLGYKPKRIDLEDWLAKWTPGMEKDHRMVAVFPVAESQTTTASPLKLKSDLEEELTKYE
jgi:Protein of unknown function (DUF2750)